MSTFVTVGAWRRLLVLPRVAWGSARAPRGRGAAWDAYWASVDHGGAAGDVLWDAATPRELAWSRDQAVMHLDPALPVVDVGCGNGTQTLLLAGLFRTVVGVDVSVAAIALARRRVAAAASGGSVSFRVLDAAAPGAGRVLADTLALGPVNVHLRGLLHVLDDAQRRTLVDNLADLVDGAGTVLLAETAFRGSRLRYLEHLGVGPRSFPDTVTRCLRAGIPMPRMFDRAALSRWFTADAWTVRSSGDVPLDVVTPGAATAITVVPGFYAVLRPRSAQGEPAARPTGAVAVLPPTSDRRGVRASFANARAFTANPIDFHRALTGADGRYRDVVAFDLFGPNLLVNDAHLAGAVLANPVATDPYTKDGSRFFEVIRRVLADGLFTAEGEPHLRTRRLLRPRFQPAAIPGLLAGVASACGRLAAAWSERAGDVLDVQQDMQRFALDVLTETVVGADLRAETAVFAALEERLEESLLAVLHAPIVLPQAVPTPANRRLRRACVELDTIAAKIVAGRAAARAAGVDPSPSPLLAGLLADPAVRADMTDEQVRAEVATLLVGGYNSTAAALTWTWYLLAAHPAAAARVREEANAFAGAAPDADLPPAPYTRAVIAEALRLYPPVWGITRMAARTVNVDGLHVPRGATLMISPYTLHRNPAAWPDPNRFDPARWLSGAPGRGHAYLPFGAGRHKCVGDRFALTVLCASLLRLGDRFAFEPPSRPVHPAARAFSYAPGGMRLRVVTVQPE
jgi:enediyne biosynthesis protein E7